MQRQSSAEGFSFCTTDHASALCENLLPSSMCQGNSVMSADECADYACALQLFAFYRVFLTQFHSISWITTTGYLLLAVSKQICYAVLYRWILLHTNKVCFAIFNSQFSLGMDRYGVRRYRPQTISATKDDHISATTMTAKDIGCRLHTWITEALAPLTSAIEACQ